MGPKTTPSLISKGGYQIPPLGEREIDTPLEIGLKGSDSTEIGCIFILSMSTGLAETVDRISNLFDNVTLTFTRFLFISNSVLNLNL